MTSTDHVAPSPQPASLDRGSYRKILLEVALITIGVFFALLADEWRERAQHQQMAEDTLRRFRTEFKANRDAVASVKDKHVESLAAIGAYFAAEPATRSKMAYPFMSTNPAFMEYTAWDLAIATPPHTSHQRGCYGATGSKCSGSYHPIAMRAEPPGPWLAIACSM